MKVCEKTKKLRKSKKLTQGELAEKAGISGNHLSRLERGVFQRSIDVVKRLAQVLDVNVYGLLSGEDEASPAVSIKNKELTERVRMIDQLKPDDQQAIMRVIDSMLTRHKMQKLLTGSIVEA
ncbi:MAG: helix-turn-helix domain-containing protein [Proteobacteria bacterium]|nr:helix-turn-helix domain-containing protein [Pseudomonadota bacterium]MBU1737841.1 helix-turn-helix domain-containing protein [Pseudomonadota bacterium]